MAEPLVPNLPLHVLQQSTSESRSHGRLRVRTQSYCAERGNITFSQTEEILFLQTETAFRERRARQAGVRGHTHELTGMDAGATPHPHAKFKWASFVMSALNCGRKSPCADWIRFLFSFGESNLAFLMCFTIQGLIFL